jgi:hypothetical protein
LSLSEMGSPISFEMNYVKRSHISSIFFSAIVYRVSSLGKSDTRADTTEA